MWQHCRREKSSRRPLCVLSSRPSPYPRPAAKSLSISRLTYARELGAAVTALGDSAALLDVKQTKVTTGSLDDSGSVGGGVVAARSPMSVPISVRRQVVRSTIQHRARSRGNSRVAAAVSDSLGNHFGGVVGSCNEDLTKNEEFRDLGKFCVGEKMDCAR